LTPLIPWDEILETLSEVSWMIYPPMVLSIILMGVSVWWVLGTWSRNKDWVRRGAAIGLGLVMVQFVFCTACGSFAAAIGMIVAKMAIPQP